MRAGNVDKVGRPPRAFVLGCPRPNRNMVMSGVKEKDLKAVYFGWAYRPAGESTPAE